MLKLLQPDLAIDSWRAWDGEYHSRPVILRPLGGGRSNRSFLLASEDKRMVLRLNSSASVMPGVDRNREIAIWTEASHQGIAPPLLYADGHDRFLVSTYIDNYLPLKPPSDEALARQALELLSRTHKLNVDAPGIDYAGHVEHFWQLIDAKNQLSNPALIEQRRPMESVLESLMASKPPTGLCHHDPVIANFVGSTKRLYLIDWEYAARGILAMDFAALSVEWGIDDEKIRSHAGIEPESLAIAKMLYNYLCDLWKELKF
jgi:thiamine kinase-like enzyme